MSVEKKYLRLSIKDLDFQKKYGLTSSQLDIMFYLLQLSSWAKGYECIGVQGEDMKEEKEFSYKKIQVKNSSGIIITIKNPDKAQGDL